MDLGEGLLSPGDGQYKSDDQRSLSSISSLTSRSFATNRIAAMHRVMRQQEQDQVQVQLLAQCCIELSSSSCAILDEAANAISAEGELHSGEVPL